MFILRHAAAFHLLPRLLPVGASALGSVMTGVSVKGLAMDSQTVSQQSRNSLAEPFADPFCQGVRLLDPATVFRRRCRLLGVCGGFTRVVCETVERVVIQDRCWFMANTESPMIRKTAHPSNED